MNFKNIVWFIKAISYFVLLRSLKNDNNNNNNNNYNNSNKNSFEDAQGLNGKVSLILRIMNVDINLPRKHDI